MVKLNFLREYVKRRLSREDLKDLNETKKREAPEGLPDIVSDALIRENSRDVSAAKDVSAS